MANIKDVKVWKNAGRTETRVYVHADDGREGCLYLTANKWHAQNEREGNLTEAEWDTARALSNKAHSKGNGWHTIYENEMWEYDDDKRAAQEAINAQARAGREAKTAQERSARILSEHAKNTNQYVEVCARCGESVEVGAGWGEYITEKNTDEEDLDFIYRGRTGWFYYHTDSSVCDRNRANKKVEQQRVKDAKTEKEDAWQKQRDDATLGMVEVEDFEYKSTFTEIATRREDWSHSAILRRRPRTGGAATRQNRKWTGANLARFLRSVKCNSHKSRLANVFAASVVRYAICKSKRRIHPR